MTKMKFETLDVAGFSPAFEGMRNPLKSYYKADSYCTEEGFYFGPNDYDLAKRLRIAGKEHAKWMRQVVVWVSITAPRFFWSEFDTYKIATVANSESTMHKIKDENFDEEDFDFEWGVDQDADSTMRDLIFALKSTQKRMNNCNDNELKSKYHRILKGMLPESFMQKRTVMLNYQVLQNMYEQRKNHSLPQWNDAFVSWIKTLPFNEFITGDFQ